MVELKHPILSIAQVLQQRYKLNWLCKHVHNVIKMPDGPSLKNWPPGADQREIKYWSG